MQGLIMTMMQRNEENNDDDHDNNSVASRLLRIRVLSLCQMFWGPNQKFGGPMVIKYLSGSTLHSLLPLSPGGFSDVIRLTIELCNMEQKKNVYIDHLHLIHWHSLSITIYYFPLVD